MVVLAHWLPHRLLQAGVGLTTYVREQSPAAASLPPQLYDIWVTRDVGGRRLDKNLPLAVGHGPSALRLALGLPTAAYCCWVRGWLRACKTLRLGSRRACVRIGCPSASSLAAVACARAPGTHGFGRTRV